MNINQKLPTKFIRVKNQLVTKEVSPWILVGVSILYVLLPFDIIPDLPVLGWFDDLFILSTSILYLIEKKYYNINNNLREAIRLMRIIMVMVGFVMVFTILIFTILMFNILGL